MISISGLTPATLLRDTTDGDVLSLYHRAWDATDGRSLSPIATTIDIMRQIQECELELASSDAKPDVPTCRMCGCTDEYGCLTALASCSWASHDDSVCSFCTPRKARR